MIYSVKLLILCLSLVPFSVAKDSKKDPWLEWKKKLVESYQEVYSVPTITHHTYFEKVGEKAWLNLKGQYPRFSKKPCVQCDWQVAREAKKVILAKNIKTKKQVRLTLKKETPLPGSKTLLLTAMWIDPGKIRVFLHDMGQKNLQQKRQRKTYTYNPKYKTKAQFNWLKKPRVAKIQRSDGSQKEMPIVAELSYDLFGKKGQLSIYNFMGAGNNEYKKRPMTMLLFRDLSNGKKTYGAGRFLTVDFKKPVGALKNGDRVSLDFNYAYNPPCAASTGFHCPLPQDIIQHEVLVGEKYLKH